MTESHTGRVVLRQKDAPLKRDYFTVQNTEHLIYN